MDYTKHVIDRKVTSQDTKVPGVKKQKRNSAGGISFKLDKWDYLKRFLILGTEGGTFYVDEQKLTRDAAKNVQKCIDSDGKKAVNIIVNISTSGRSANNDAAIFALAMAASCSDTGTRKYALGHLNQVCRIGTHLFHFIAFVKTMRGFGRSLKNAIGKWYTSQDVDALAYQMLKYQGRDGWTHADAIRLGHPAPVNDDMEKMFQYAVGKIDTIPSVSDYAIGMQKVKDATRVTEVYNLIKEYRLTREAIPTNYLNAYAVWEGLLETMPMGALVRNLGKMASLGMHKMMSDTEKLTVEKLTNPEAVAKSRIHPMQVMNAFLVYNSESGIKGNLSWKKSAKVLAALEECFYMSFKNVEPSRKKILLALDVSGSMGSRMNNSVMSCRVASAVMAMVTMRNESHTDILGFTGGRQWANAVSRLPLHANMSITEVVDAISGLPFGSTDCALPMKYCMVNNVDVDAIAIYTDNETYVGDVHPWQALDQMQQKFGHEVKSIVVGMTATRFSIARPDYPNMLDVVGFDTFTPAILSEFIKN